MRTYRKKGKDILVKRKQSKWKTPAKRAEVVTAYLTLGNSKLVESLTGVNAVTIRSWRTMEWWKELETTIRDEENLALDVKLSAIVGKTLDLLNDRVTHGDFLYDSRKGQLIRKPLNAHVANQVLSNSFDRRQVLRKKVVEENVNSVKPEDFLRRLAEEFVKIAKGGRPVIDVEVVPLKEIKYAQETGAGTQEASSQETSGEGKNGGLRVWNSSSENRLGSEHPEKGEVTNEPPRADQDRGRDVQGTLSSEDGKGIDGGDRSRQESDPGKSGSKSGDGEIFFTP